MATTEFADILEKFNLNDTKNIVDIFPKTNNLVDEIHAVRFVDELHPGLDSAARRIKITVDVKDTSRISEIIAEITECISNYPAYKKSIDELRELRESELDEIENSIMTAEESSEKVNAQAQPNSSLVELKSRKIFLEQSLKNNLNTEITYRYVYSNPVKPHIKRNISLMGIVSFLSVVLVIIVGSWVRKFNTPKA
jgi:hypothetical protein